MQLISRVLVSKMTETVLQFILVVHKKLLVGQVSSMRGCVSLYWARERVVMSLVGEALSFLLVLWATEIGI